MPFLRRPSIAAKLDGPFTSCAALTINSANVKKHGVDWSAVSFDDPRVADNCWFRQGMVTPPLGETIYNPLSITGPDDA
jgi:hypothetical protein